MATVLLLTDRTFSEFLYNFKTIFILFHFEFRLCWLNWEILIFPFTNSGWNKCAGIEFRSIHNRYTFAQHIIYTERDEDREGKRKRKIKTFSMRLPFILWHQRKLCANTNNIRTRTLTTLEKSKTICGNRCDKKRCPKNLR